MIFVLDGPPLPPSQPYSLYGPDPMPGLPGKYSPAGEGNLLSPRAIQGVPTMLSIRTSKLSVPGGTTKPYAFSGTPTRSTCSTVPAAFAVPRSLTNKGLLCSTPLLVPVPIVEPVGPTPSLTTAR